jgi:phage baseplate assembly protein gpV
MINAGAGFSGFESPTDFLNEFNSQYFLVWSILSRIATATLVQVQAVTTAGGVAPVGFVDILPLVNQVDGAGNTTPHGIIYNCPYFRMQGGTNAIILDPQVGDIGIAIFASRDLSSAIASRAQAPPGSARMYDMADALYIGGVLNAIPTQFVEFSTTGIRISSPTQVKLDAPDVLLQSGSTLEIDAQSLSFTAPSISVTASTGFTLTTPTLTINGNIASNGTITNNGIPVDSTHVHTGVTSGSSNTGTPL